MKEYLKKVIAREGLVFLRFLGAACVLGGLGAASEALDTKPEPARSFDKHASAQSSSDARASEPAGNVGQATTTAPTSRPSLEELAGEYPLGHVNPNNAQPTPMSLEALTAQETGIGYYFGGYRTRQKTLGEIISGGAGAGLDTAIFCTLFFPTEETYTLAFRNTGKEPIRGSPFAEPIQILLFAADGTSYEIPRSDSGDFRVSDEVINPTDWRAATYPVADETISKLVRTGGIDHILVKVGSLDNNSYYLKKQLVPQKTRD